MSDHAPDTSAAVPRRVTASSQGPRALDAETRAHVARCITRWWTRTSRISSLSLVVPIAGCNVLGAVAPTLSDLFIALAMLLLFANLPLNLVLRGIARRAIRDEVKLLGFDVATEKIAVRAWEKAMRSFLPTWSSAARERAVQGALDELVRRAR